MTTETKDKIKGWLWAVNLSLVGFIAGGMAWLLTTMSTEVKSNANEIIELKVITYNLAVMTENNKRSDDDWRNDITAWRNAVNQKLDKQQEEYMELWKQQKRGSSINIDKYKEK